MTARSSSLLGCPDVPAVSENGASDGGAGLCRPRCRRRYRGPGVAGPAPLEGNDPGDVWFATCIDGVAEAHFLKMPSIPSASGSSPAS